MNANLHYGKPTGYDFDTLVDQFSVTNLNSTKTSTVPLVQYWKSTETSLQELFDYLKLEDASADLCFEFPTENKGRGRSSMTDLMILRGDYKIAIEAKYKEYVEKGQGIKLIKKWFDDGDNQDNRQIVLNGWTEMIKELSPNLKEGAMEEIDYQFYHRTASACNGSKKAVVVYQLFYEETPEWRSAKERFKNDLGKWAALINPDSNPDLRFVVWAIPTELIATNVKKDNVFIEMKQNEVYKFGKGEFFEFDGLNWKK